MNPIPPPPPPPPPPLNTFDAPQRPMDGFSVAALVLGICGIFFGWLWVIPPILGVVLGGVSLRRINRSKGWKTGKKMAIVGLVLGVTGIVIWVSIFIAAAAQS